MKIQTKQLLGTQTARKRHQVSKIYKHTKDRRERVGTDTRDVVMRGETIIEAHKISLLTENLNG
jgi:hypothetical protein